MSAETGAVGELYCPLCERTYGEGDRCPQDNTRLVRIAQSTEALIGRDLDGRYTIVEKIGQGGMGAVYRGTQHSVGREVAIKVVTPSLVTEPVTIKRFLREATIASRLSHPNAVSVLDFGQTKDGLFYLVMELVAGRTLDAVVEKDGRLTPARIVRIGSQICDALEGAHQLEIVHRDLKPQNVIVLSTGRDLIKVLDFGLAKSLSKDVASSTMTNAGALLGSPAFMPPEVVTAQKTDARADLYSLGCLLYYCAAGRLPFEANTIHELIAMHASETPKRLTNIPARLATVLDRLLAKNPDDRYPTAATTREALEESLGKTLSPNPMMVPPREAPPAATPAAPAPAPEETNATVLGWDGASSSKSAPGAAPVRHSGAARAEASGALRPVVPTPAAGVPVRPGAPTPTAGAPVRHSSANAASRSAAPPADPRMIIATPIDPRTGRPVDRVATPPAGVPISTAPSATPFGPQQPGTNPSAVPPFAAHPGTNPAGAPLEPHHAALATPPHLPLATPPHGPFSSAHAPSANAPSPASRTSPPRKSPVLFIVIAILALATGGIVAFIAAGGL